MALFGWLAYGVGHALGRSLIREGRAASSAGPVRQGTEEDFRRDEARFAEDERRIERGDEPPKSRER